jgi:pyrroloquinoline quinone biosynthesis protein E
MPTRQQVARAAASAVDIRARLGSSVEIVYVQPDYHDTRPKPCMNGWGSRQLVVSPSGDVLPCLAAGAIPDLGVQNVRDHALRDIWYHSPAFEAFRGTAWMKSPCRECPRREIDFGGCRCQAYAITGDAAAADPVCELSPHHGLVAALSTAATTSERRLPVPRRYR